MKVKSDGRIEAILNEVGKFFRFKDGKDRAEFYNIRDSVCYTDSNDMCDNICHSMCDIGTDHGFISAEAVLRGIVPCVIATDISEKSLKKARKLFGDLNITDVIETRVGDGLGVVDFFEVGVFVIAGMGGRNIAEILRGRTPLSSNGFVLVPHQNSPFLREFLIENGYEILRDRCVFSSGKFYDIISAAYVGGGFRFDILKGREDFDGGKDDGEGLSERGVLKEKAVETDGKSGDFQRGVLGEGEVKTDKKGGELGKISEYKISDDMKRKFFLEFGRDNFFAVNDDFKDKLTKKINEFDNILKTVYNRECENKKKLFCSALSFYESNIEHGKNAD
jgi:hypothetical protein